MARRGATLLMVGDVSFAPTEVPSWRALHVLAAHTFLNVAYNVMDPIYSVGGAVGWGALFGTHRHIRI